MEGVIYKATNKINGKVYIGQTSRSLKIRMKEHKNGAKYEHYNSAFHASIRKYGFKNFEWVVLAKAKQSRKMDRLERKFIKQYKSNRKANGYNLTIGGSVLRGKNATFYGKKHSEESKRKMSLANKGKPGPNLGKKLSDETKKRLSDSMKIAMAGENNPMYGRKHSKETRDRIRAKHLGKKIPEKNLKHLIENWLVIYPDGNKKIIRNLNKFCKKNDLNQGNMSMVAKGVFDNHKGYKCRKLYDFCVKKW